MKVTAKFFVEKVALLSYSDGSNKPAMCHKGGVKTDVPVREITMRAAYGNSPENKSFAEATPTGQLIFTLNNSDLKDEFEVGSSYYLTFDKVENPS